MYIIFDKRKGIILYTIENQVEEIRLEETQGLIESNEKISILDYYVDLNDLKLKDKIKIDIQIQENTLRIISSDKNISQVKLLIESVDGVNSVELPLVNGECSIPIKIESDKRTVFSVFSFNMKSNLLVVNDTSNTLDLSKGIII